MQMAQTLKGRVHAVNITDGSRAVLRMCPMVASVILLQHEEPICQVACRDRIDCKLTSCWVLMPRHPQYSSPYRRPVKAGDHTDAKSVFDESVRLLRLIHKLNHGFDYNDQPLTDGATDLFVGAAIDPQLASWSGLQSRFERKLEAGAQFFQSQLVTDFDRLEKFMDKIAAGSDKPILAGIFCSSAKKRSSIAVFQV